MAKKIFQLNWGTTIALIVSFAALITTIYEANILKAQQQALVWPYLEVNPSWSGQGFGVKAKNSGTGPAIVTSVEVLYDGEPISSFTEILDQLDRDSVLNYYQFTYHDLNKTVLRSGEERFVFLMGWTPYTRSIIEDAKPISFKIEYKSVLDDYWVFDSEEGTIQEGRFKSRLEFQSY